jgi:hypothetical protein
MVKVTSSESAPAGMRSSIALSGDTRAPPEGPIGPDPVAVAGALLESQCASGTTARPKAATTSARAGRLGLTRRKAERRGERSIGTD